MEYFAALAMSLVLFGVAPVLAADVDGKWTGTVMTPMGDFPVAYEFKAEGAMLTGSTMGPDGGQIPIKNGKIDGNNISFQVSLDFGGMPLELYVQGSDLGQRDYDHRRLRGDAVRVHGQERLTDVEKWVK